MARGSVSGRKVLGVRVTDSQVWWEGRSLLTSSRCALCTYPDVSLEVFPPAAQAVPLCVFPSWQKSHTQIKVRLQFLFLKFLNTS